MSSQAFIKYCIKKESPRLLKRERERPELADEEEVLLSIINTQT